MTTSENLAFEAQIKNFFISWKNNVPFLKYSNFYTLNHFINLKNYDVMIKISTQSRVYF